MSKTIKIFIAFLLGVVSFVFFLLLFFPLDSIFNHYLANLENITGGQYKITVKDMKPSLIFDSEFKGLQVFQKTESGFEEIFSSSKIDVDISLFALITQTVDLEFSAKFAGGDIQGRLTATEQKNILELKLKQVKLHKLGYAQELLSTDKYSVKVQGEMNGDIFLSLSSQGFRQHEAEFNLKLKNLVIQKAKIFFEGAAMDLPPMTLSTKDSVVTLEGSLANRQLRIHDLVVPGPDIDLQLKGKLNLSQRKSQVQISRINVKGRFAFTEKLEKQLPLFLITEQKTTDGYYPLSITGRMSKPKILVGEMDLAPMLGL